MLDKDVIEILEPLLADGEDLLWAEKTNHHAQDLHKEWFEITPKKKRALLTVLLLALVGLLMSFAVPKGINNWGTTSQILFYQAVSGIALCAFLISAVLLFLSRLINKRVYKIGAYALTNKRLFELDHDLNIIRSLDASRIRHVYGMEGVSIKPIGAKGSRAYQLGLMDNNVLTINYLHARISKAQDENA